MRCGGRGGWVAAQVASSTTAAFTCIDAFVRVCRRRGWPPGGEAAYDVDYALVACRMRGFREGLLLLYEVGAGGGGWGGASRV
jgi:hypothetical protein